MVQGVVFGHPFPHALRFYWASISGGLTPVLGGFYLDLRELLVVFQPFHVVAPKPRLSFEVQIVKWRRASLGTGLFDVDVGWQPHTGLEVQAPTVEVQIIAVARMRSQSTIQSEDVDFAVFPSDSSCQRPRRR